MNEQTAKGPEFANELGALLRSEEEGVMSIPAPDYFFLYFSTRAVAPPLGGKLKSTIATRRS